MLTNIIYVSATCSLLIGSILSFESDELSDYFYLIGTSLFFIKSNLNLALEITNRKRHHVDVYHAIN